jgi:hypothetical protein
VENGPFKTNLPSFDIVTPGCCLGSKLYFMFEYLKNLSLLCKCLMPYMLLRTPPVTTNASSSFRVIAQENTSSVS